VSRVGCHATCMRSLLTRICEPPLGMTRKSLQRLFPCDTNMVVIIDDRADVWDGSPNLVKVIPCESSRHSTRSGERLSH
jgi:TFIIF-interacting CTD phosphatase-like protein